MRLFFGVLSLCVFLFLASCSSTRSHGPVEEPRFEEKSVIVGELIAIFPGLFWHGLGHRYAGDLDKASQMELLEATSILAGGAGYGLIEAGRSNDDLRGLQIPGYGIGGAAALTFLGSWIYDILYTPSAVKRYNAMGRAE